MPSTLRRLNRDSGVKLLLKGRKRSFSSPLKPLVSLKRTPTVVPVVMPSLPHNSDKTLEDQVFVFCQGPPAADA